MWRKWSEWDLAVVPAERELALLQGRLPGRDAARKADRPAHPLPSRAGPRVPLRCEYDHRGYADVGGPLRESSMRYFFRSFQPI